MECPQCSESGYTKRSGCRDCHFGQKGDGKTWNQLGKVPEGVSWYYYQCQATELINELSPSFADHVMYGRQCANTGKQQHEWGAEVYYCKVHREPHQRPFPDWRSVLPERTRRVALLDDEVERDRVRALIGQTTRRLTMKPAFGEEA